MLLLVLVFLVFIQSQAQPAISFNSVITGLAAPVDIVNAGDNSNRLFVVQQTGTIKVYDQAFSYLADPASMQVVLTIAHPGQSNHNGGKLNFGTDGYLYFATGDGGASGDVPNNAQTGSSLLGKMLRLNVNTSVTGDTKNIGAVVILKRGRKQSAIFSKKIIIRL